MSIVPSPAEVPLEPIDLHSGSSLSDLIVTTLPPPSRPTGYRHFSQYSRYTTTQVAAVNWLIDCVTLFQHIRIPKLQTDPLKGVKRNDLIRLNVPDGTVLRVKYKDAYKRVHVRGYGSGDGCFRNSVTVVMYIGKIVVLKVPNVGKIQIAGCLHEGQVYKAIHAIWKHLQLIAQNHPEVVKIPEGELPRVIYNPVMNNISIDLQFQVTKRKIHEFLYRETEFSIIPNNRKYAGVTAKLEATGVKKLPLVMNRFIDGKWYASSVDWHEYLAILRPKDRIKEDKKTRYHTFLIFHSGRVIQTSPRYELMEEAFDYFMSLVTDNRALLEDTNIELTRKKK